MITETKMHLMGFPWNNIWYTVTFKEIIITQATITDQITINLIMAKYILCQIITHGRQHISQQIQQYNPELGASQFRKNTLSATCQSCQSKVMTTVTAEYPCIMTLYFVLAFLLFFPILCMGCWLKATFTHSCPKCGCEIGRGYNTLSD